MSEFKNGDEVEVWGLYTERYEKGFTYIGPTTDGRHVLQSEDGSVSIYLDFRHPPKTNE